MKKYNYNFLNLPAEYLLQLNGRVIRTYPKHRYSKQEAEEKASDVVNDSVRKYGMDNVTFDGAYLVTT